MKTEIDQNDQRTLGVILAGGAGQRLGGMDKGLQIYRGQPLIAWVIAAIQPQVEEIILCVNRNRAEYGQFGHTTVVDNQPDYQGPIAGIVAALDYLEASSRSQEFTQILISSCDSPALPGDYVRKLSQQLRSSTTLVAVVNDGTRNQNMHCLIRRGAWDSLRDYYRDGGRAMYRWFRQCGVLEVDFSEQADRFLNINSADQLSHS